MCDNMCQPCPLKNTFILPLFAIANYGDAVLPEHEEIFCLQNAFLMLSVQYITPTEEHFILTLSQLEASGKDCVVC